MSKQSQEYSGAAHAAVIIPAHNESRFLDGLLDSVRLYGPVGAQVIVVDNGSTDGTAEIAARHGATTISVPHRIIPSLARNIGAAKARPDCEILVFLDADVLLTAEWRAEWEKSAPALLEDKNQLTGASYDISKRPGWIERHWFAALASRIPTSINGGNLITSRELFDRLNGFDTRLETGEDVDFCVRAQRAGAILTINRGFRTHHEGNPRTISAFVKRERWHGAGDFVSLRHAVASKVVLAATLFGALHLLMIAGAVCALVYGGSYGLPLASLLGIVGVCWMGAKNIGGRGGRGVRPQTIVIVYFYYVGRLLSMWDAIKRKRSASAPA